MRTVLLPVMVGAVVGVFITTGLVLYGIDSIVQAYRWATR